MTDMDTTGRTVVGLFRDRAHAQAAIRDLRITGFDENRIGLAMQAQADRGAPTDTGTQAAETAAAGVVSGSLLGGLIGLLGSLLIPGIGPVVAGGVLVTVDAGARTGEALAILQRHEVDLGPGGPDRYGPVERRRERDLSYAGPERRVPGM